MTMVIPGQTDSAFTLLALLADPKAAQQQLKDLIDATNTHQKALDDLLTERAKQRSIDGIKSDYASKELDLNNSILEYQKVRDDYNNKQSSLSTKQEELNQRIAQFNKYLEDTKANMNVRENSLSQKEKIIEESLAKTQSESVIAAALRKSLEAKHKQISQIVNDPT